MKTQSSRLLLATALTAIASTLLIGCNKAPETQPVTQAPASTVGMQVDDTVITSKVKAALLTDPDVKSFDISVLTLKGEVQLTGTVDNQGQIDQAVQIARAAEGVSGVKNELRIKQ